MNRKELIAALADKTGSSKGLPSLSLFGIIFGFLVMTSSAWASQPISAAKSTVVASPVSVPANGISASTITVTLLDAHGNPVSGKTVTLAAGSGSSTITTVSGTTDANGQATFTVKDLVVEAVIYAATDTTDGIMIRRTATVTFTVVAVSNFNAFETATAAGAITGVIHTKIAGAPFGLDVVAISGTAQASTFTGAVKVELLGNTVTGIALDAQNCPTSFTLLQTLSPNPTITGGRSTVGFTAVANAWKDVRVRISYPVAAPTVTACSTDNFAVRPFSFSPVTATDLDWQTAGTTNSLISLSATANPIHKAGQPFTLQATAVNAAAVTTTNYTGTPITVLSPCAGTACTATFGTFFIGTATATAGVINSTTATYSEAGAFALQLQDQTFASVDAADGTTADCAGQYVCSAALNVGRFVPDHFDTIVVPGIPCPTGLACPTMIVANDQGFVYSGQTFTTNVIARNLAGATTINYDNAKGLAKAVTLTAWDAPGSATTQNPPAATPGSVGNGIIAAAAFNQGSTVAPGSPGTPSYSLPNPYPSATAPPGPTDVYLRAADTDNVTSLRAAASVEGGIKIVSGRMKLSSAHGSELLRLPIAATIQYWNGTSYVTSATDSTTTLDAALVNSGNWTGLTPGNWQKLSPTSTWAAGSTWVLSPSLASFISGIGSFLLAAPGASNTGSVDITANTPSYLPSNTSRATFGVYKGGNEFIYLRENY